MADDMRERIAEVFRGLPVLTSRWDEIDDHAKEIVATFDAFGVSLPKEAGHKASLRYLAKMVKHAQRLSVDLASMPDNVHAAICISLAEKGLPRAENLLEVLMPTMQIDRDVRRLIDVLHDATERLVTNENWARKGRPPSRQAAAVAKMAALVFVRLTGKPATPGFNEHMDERSPFENFLWEIYEVLGITANAEARAKSLKVEFAEINADARNLAALRDKKRKK